MKKILIVSILFNLILIATIMSTKEKPVVDDNIKFISSEVHYE